MLNKNEQKVPLDLSKAFDTVDILPGRLNSRVGRVTCKALDWFTSYLSDRLQRVAVNECLSSVFPPLKHGVPQRSFLGPLLFTIYTS